MEYNKKHCNIKGCDKNIYKNYMCKHHYDFYINNEKTKKLSDDVIAVHDKKAKIIQKIRAIIHFLLHHILDIPMVRYEHFPLEHIFLNSLKTGNINDVKRMNQIISDFDIPENENIAMMKRVVDSNNVSSLEIRSKEEYLFGEKDFVSKWTLLISLIGCLGIYIILRFYGLSGTYFGINADKAIEIYRNIFPLMIVVLIGMYFGILIPHNYNFFSNRAYDLKFYNLPKDNLELLIQIQYVKNRNQRINGYVFTMIGIFFALISWTVQKYFTTSDISSTGIILMISSLMMTLPILYCYNIIVLYFPVFDCMKRKNTRIDLYHPDKTGGQKEIKNFLFQTFVFNEAIIYTAFSIGKMFGNWWLIIILFFGVIIRANHAGWCIIMFIKSIIEFHKKKKDEIDKLMVSGKKNAISDINILENVNYIHIFGKIGVILSVIVIPYCINHIDDWIPIISTFVANKAKYLFDLIQF